MTHAPNALAQADEVLDMLAQLRRLGVRIKPEFESFAAAQLHHCMTLAGADVQSDDALMRALTSLKSRTPSLFIDAPAHSRPGSRRARR